MVVIEQWTGQYACLLQAALRSTNVAFAQDLGIAVRTVAGWHDKPELVPRAEVQAILDTTLERAPAGAVERFARMLGAEHSAPVAAGAQALKVAIAVVRRGGDVLLVCRRDTGGGAPLWQFPAGVIKPGGQTGTVAVRETLAETGIHCALVRTLGSRVHPATGVLCEYVLCDYLTGQARNADSQENLDVAWVPVADLSRFIPLETVFAPILDALEDRHDRRPA